MSYRSRGQTWARQQSETEIDPRSGRLDTQQFYGLRKDLEAIAISPSVAHLKRRISPGDGPMATLTVEHPGGETVTDQPTEVDWIFDGSAALAPLTELPRIADDLASASDLDIMGLRRRLESATEANFSPALQAIPDIDALIQFTDRQVTNFYRPEPTLTYQAIYQRGAGFRPTLAVMGVVYLASTLINTFVPDADTEYIINTLGGGEWLLEHLSLRSSSTGARNYTLQWRWAWSWGRHPQTGDPFIYSVL